MVVLTPVEKKEMCIELAKYLPRIRQILRLSQHEFALRVGTSKERLSAVENGRYIMRWNQLCAILFLLSINRSTKEYFFSNKILSPRFLQYMQQKDETYVPEVNISVPREVANDYLAAI